MRRSHAPRPTGGRRTVRRRRRAIAPVVRAGGSLRLRTHILSLAAKTRFLAHRINASAARLAGIVSAIPVRAALRKTAKEFGLVSSAAHTHLTGGILVARRRLALTVAGCCVAWKRAWRRFAGARLPEIPGRDPVMFGAAVGVAIIVTAGLVVLIGGTLREQGEEDKTTATVAAGEPGSFPEPGGPASVTTSGVAVADQETQTPRGIRGLVDGIVEPAPGVVTAQDRDTADQDENLAAALPLLDMPADRTGDTVRRGPVRPPLPTLPDVHGARPPAPAARPQWLANAVPTGHSPGGKPMIAIVIDDAGVAQERTARAIELPPPLTIAFIPYSRNLEQQTRRAREYGHELLLHIPMEPGSAAIDPGPNALLTTLDRDEIMRRFRWALARFEGYVGVNNHMGSKFMARADLVEPLLAEMRARGLLFLDSRTDSRTVGAELARTMALPHASRQVFLDNDLDAERIRGQLAELERVARLQGHAIAIGHPHDVTVDVLAKWIPEARVRGFDLVPVSAIVRLAYGSDASSQLAAAAGGGEPDGLLGSAQ